MSEACTACQKAPPEVTLKRCAKCSRTPYCSRDCQKADWRAHKKICGREQGGPMPSFASTANPDGGSLSPPKGLDQPISKPFTRLDNNIWLHDRPEKDVYRLLVDAYRMRVEDNYAIDGEVDRDSLYSGRADGLVDFRRFLRLTEARRGLLPPWWSAEKKKKCEDLGMDAGQWSDLRCAIEKHDVMEHYGDSRFPMQLRMFAEEVYGSAPGGTPGKGMRQFMMAMEG